MARKTVYNDIVTPELWQQVNQENKDILQEFIEYLQSTDKSPLTIINYESDIKICFIWTLQKCNNKEFTKFTKRDIMKYQNYLMNVLNLSSNRIRRLKSSISSMSNFIENVLDDDFPKFRNIVNKIPAPVKQPVREKTILEEDQVQKLLDYLVEKKEYQKACAFALAISSGSRKAEILRFKVSYFTEENIIYGALYKTPEKIKTKGRSSKGKLIYRYVLVNKFKPYLDLWLKEREKLNVDFDDLFVSKRLGQYKPMPQSTLDSWADSFSKILDVDFYWHSLRHFFTTDLCKANLPAEVIKNIVGWESTDMVSIYNDTDVDEEIGKYFNEDGVKQVEQKSLSDL